MARFKRSRGRRSVKAAINAAFWRGVRSGKRRARRSKY